MNATFRTSISTPTQTINDIVAIHAGEDTAVAEAEAALAAVRERRDVHMAKIHAAQRGLNGSIAGLAEKELRKLHLELDAINDDIKVKRSRRAELASPQALRLSAALRPAVLAAAAQVLEGLATLKEVASHNVHISANPALTAEDVMDLLYVANVENIAKRILARRS